MRRPYFPRPLALLSLVLAACVSSTPLGREEALREAVSSWEAAREDASCTVPVCDEARCALWRCADLAPVDVPAIVPTRGTLTLRPPPGAPIRWWGRPLASPFDHEPVFEIPWHNWNIRGQYAPRVFRVPCLPAREPFEKHHIFPQEPLLADWFKNQKIDIHAYTIRVPKSFHSWLHSGGARGGQWNEAWRRFQEEKFQANAEEMWRFAFELMERFGVQGPLVAYYCQDR